MSDQNFDELHKHEVRHMSLFLAEAVENQLINHSYLKSKKDLLDKAKEANELLLDIYQNVD